MAAKLGELDKVKRLVDEGADVNIQDENEVSVIRVHLDVFDVVFLRPVHSFCYNWKCVSKMLI